MNDQEINRAVAESVSLTCMTTECEFCDGCGELGGESDAYHCPKCKGTGVCSPRYIGADYCNSYDAVMPLVKALKGMQRNRFADHLFKAVFPNEYIKGWMFTHMMHEYITATPRQLCEVYLAVEGADA